MREEAPENEAVHMRQKIGQEQDKAQHCDYSSSREQGRSHNFAHVCSNTPAVCIHDVLVATR